MEQLDDYTFTSRGRGASRYDFDKLFDGGIYRLRRGDDFDAKSDTKSVRGYLHTQASRRGKSLRTEAEDDDTIVIQARPKTAKAKPAKRSRSKAKPKPAPAET